MNVVTDAWHGAAHVVIQWDRRGQRTRAGAVGEEVLMHAEIVEKVELGIAADPQRRVRAGDQYRTGKGARAWRGLSLRAWHSE